MDLRTVVDRYQHSILDLPTPAMFQILIQALPSSMSPLHATKTPDAVDYAKTLCLKQKKCENENIMLVKNNDGSLL